MEDSKYIQNMAVAGTLFEAGVSVMRENIRRRHADASPQGVNDLLDAWMRREGEPLPADALGLMRFRKRL